MPAVSTASAVYLQMGTGFAEKTIGTDSLQLGACPRIRFLSAAFEAIALMLWMSGQALLIVGIILRSTRLILKAIDTPAKPYTK